MPPPLVGDLADLSLTVVAVGDHSAVGIPGTGDIARKVIGIAFPPAVCRGTEKHTIFILILIKKKKSIRVFMILVDFLLGEI